MYSTVPTLIYDVILKQLPTMVLQAIENKLLQTSVSGMKYFAEYKTGRMEHKMDHLGCFSGKFLKQNNLLVYMTQCIKLCYYHLIIFGSDNGVSFSFIFSMSVSDTG